MATALHEYFGEHIRVDQNVGVGRSVGRSVGDFDENPNAYPPLEEVRNPADSKSLEYLGTAVSAGGRISI